MGFLISDLYTTAIFKLTLIPWSTKDDIQKDAYRICPDFFTGTLDGCDTLAHSDKQDKQHSIYLTCIEHILLLAHFKFIHTSIT